MTNHTSESQTSTSSAMLGGADVLPQLLHPDLLLRANDRRRPERTRYRDGTPGPMAREIQSARSLDAWAAADDADAIGSLLLAVSGYRLSHLRRSASHGQAFLLSNFWHHLCFSSMEQTTWRWE